MSGPRRALTMVNKEEKMNNKMMKMNLKINDDMYVERSEQQKKMQTIENEMDEETTHQTPQDSPQDGAERKAQEETQGQTEKGDRREHQTALRTIREQPQPTMPRSRSSEAKSAPKLDARISSMRLPDTSAENAGRSLNRGTRCSSTCARMTT